MEERQAREHERYQRQGPRYGVCGISYMSGKSSLYNIRLYPLINCNAIFYLIQS